MRLRGLMLAGTLTSCLASMLALARPIDKPESDASVRDLVYWGAGGPIRIRLHLQINGRPVDAVWSDAVNTLFAFCDRNGDGVLDTAELAPFNEPRARNQQVIQNDAGQPALRLTFDDRKAKVTRALFETALRGAGFDPVSLVITQAQPNSQRLSAALFKRLDRDGDGKLSRAELLNARTQMEFFDANEDELISVAELLGRVQSNGVRPVAQRRANAARAANASPDLVLLPGDSAAAIKQILEASGDAKSKAIRRNDFVGNTQTFTALDKNGDGRVDVAELEAWFKRPPDGELYVTEDSIKPSSGGRLVASWAKVNFRFDQSYSAQAADALWKITDQDIRQQLKKVAAKPVPPLRARMNQLDLAAFTEFASRKTAGKVEPAEVDAALKVLGQLFCCRLVLTVRDEGDGLFELLDRNGDGQLSPRELVDAVKVLETFADAGSKVGPDNLPRRFVVISTAGSIPAVLSSPVVAPASPASPTEPLPEWFTSMDRNGDGELSLREFLGPIELFRKLDKNGDGLISPDEARGVKLDK